MCLGVPGKVIAIEGTVAVVDFWGVQRNVRLDVIEETLSPGDYIINHVGYAIRRIPESEVADTLGLYEVILAEAGEDAIAVNTGEPELAGAR